MARHLQNLCWPCRFLLLLRLGKSHQNTLVVDNSTPEVNISFTQPHFNSLLVIRRSSLHFERLCVRFGSSAVVPYKSMRPVSYSKKVPHLQLHLTVRDLLRQPHLMTPERLYQTGSQLIGLVDAWYLWASTAWAHSGAAPLPPQWTQKPMSNVAAKVPT